MAIEGCGGEVQRAAVSLEVILIWPGCAQDAGPESSSPCVRSRR